MAESLWPGEVAAGKRIHLIGPGTPPVEVVGVAENLRYRAVFEKPQFFVYRPLSQVYASMVTLHVRTAGDPEALLPAIRREVAAGIAAGWLLAFFGLQNLVAAQLHATDAADPLVYAGQALLLLAAGLLGGYLSSRRIVRIEPAVILKEV